MTNNNFKISEISKVGKNEVNVIKNKNCFQINETNNKGEHFAFKKIKISKGYSFISFDVNDMSDENDLIVYLVGNQISIIFPIMKFFENTAGWKINIDKNKIKPILTQKSKVNNINRIILFFKSFTDDEIILRVQHGYNSELGYMGNNTRFSNICNFNFGKILK